MGDLENKLLDFMTETANALGRVEAKQDDYIKIIEEIKESTVKIPLIEMGLNNHLASHNRLNHYFIWPVISTITGAIMLAILHWIIRVI